jgi:hypothetical protein
MHTYENLLNNQNIFEDAFMTSDKEKSTGLVGPLLMIKEPICSDGVLPDLSKMKSSKNPLLQ